MKISKKQILGYAFAPQIIPRLRELFTTGFSYAAFFIAQVYSAVGLLPKNHPYLDADNIGRFRIRHTIAEAANNLVFSTRNIDQIILFGTILVGMVMITVQLFLLAGSLFTSPVFAAEPDNLLMFFTTMYPKQDLAHIMMDMVFGIPGVFNSCIAAGGTECVNLNNEQIATTAILGESLSFPYPIHFAIHQLFSVYSTGLMVVGAIITSYFIATVLAETAQTGTPFGKRFNKVWAPIRIVAAFGLLMPLSYGLNSAQYIVMYMAKFGSGFASNGWILFNDALSENYLQGTENLVSMPNNPEIGGLIQFMFTAKTCQAAEQLSSQDLGEVNAYFVRSNFTVPSHLELTQNTSYEEVVKFANGNKNMTLRFGIRDEKQFGLYKGYVHPTCGEITYKLQDQRPSSSKGASTEGRADKGTEIMQRYYLAMLKELWYQIPSSTVTNSDGSTSTIDNQNLATFAEAIAEKHVKTRMVNPNSADDYQRTQANASALLSDVFFFYNEDIEAAMTDPNMAGHALSGIINSDKGAIEVQRLSGKWQVSDVLKEKGWAGAGIWYNKIAEMNGAVTSAVLNLPRVSKFPVVMEEVYARKVQYDQNIDPSSRYEPGTLGNGKPMVLSSWPQADVKAKAMWEAYSYLLDISSSPKTKPTGNVFLDTISTLFGTEGLFSMRKNEDVHPLAQLVGIGRSLIDSSINNLGYAASIAATGALTGTFSNLLGATADVMVGFITSIAFFMITIGFILYYILPFIPFIYFFFAVGGWIKGIFEALVGAPLWALAHIRIDGDGLPGKAALNGYYLILEIFLRPILTVFGLIASVSIFAALVAMLNDIWDLAVSNLGGFDMKAEISDPANANPQNNGNNLEFFRSAIDQLFYTIVYAVIVYMMAMSSFKLIDLIPNNITRWLGQSVSAFNDSRENPSDQMINTSYIGGDQITSSVEGPTSNMLSKITTSTSKQSGG